jgi:hypothetical protein
MKTFKQFVKEQKIPALDCSMYYDIELPCAMIDHALERLTTMHMHEGHAISKRGLAGMCSLWTPTITPRRAAPGRHLKRCKNNPCKCEQCAYN